MSTINDDTESRLFTATYVDAAENVFLRPSPQYKWDEIVSGVAVRATTGQTRKMSAVGQNTFRGFHLLDKKSPGAGKVFVGYFIEQQQEILGAFAAVETRQDLHAFSNRLCEKLRTRLGNCKPEQLLSYNKVRKPVDLYLLHLAAMAEELGALRERLIPCLALPLDSQILAEPRLFTNEELARYRLSRKSTYADIWYEQSYVELQNLLARKAADLSVSLARPFHVIYFDLIWNGRFLSSGGNLFETNP